MRHEQVQRELYESGGASQPVYGYIILPFVIVVRQALLDKDLLRFVREEVEPLPYLCVAQWFLRP